MALPKVKLTSTKSEIKSLIKSTVGDTKLKLVPNASEKKVTGLLGLKTAHDKDGGEIGRKDYCKSCGATEFNTVYVNESGDEYTRKATEGGTFEITGRAGIDPKNQLVRLSVKDTYFVDLSDSTSSWALLWYSLYGTKTCLAGYLRLTSRSDERPALMYAEADCVIVVETLYYTDSELSPAIPIFDDSTHIDEKKLASVIKSLQGIKPVECTKMVRRDLKELMVKKDKKNEKEATK